MKLINQSRKTYGRRKLTHSYIGNRGWVKNDQNETEARA